MALLPDRATLFLSDDDKEFNEHRDNLKRIITEHTGSKRALYDEVVIVLHSIWYQRCIEKRQFAQREKMLEFKSRAGCCYRLFCSPCYNACCCCGSKKCQTFWKILLGFWAVLFFAIFVYSIALRLIYGKIQ